MRPRFGRGRGGERGDSGGRRGIDVDFVHCIGAGSACNDECHDREEYTLFKSINTFHYVFPFNVLR